MNLGAHGNTAKASRTLETGPFHSLTLSVVPGGTGTTDAWPPAPVYPDGTEITAWATRIDPEFRWDHWEGDLSGTTTTNIFVILSDITAQAVFVSSNANTYGIPESWLIGHGIPPTQQGAEMDSDEDGLLNWKEYYAGTVPTNDLSVLVLTELESVVERYSLAFLSVTGKTYRPQSTPSLTLTDGWANVSWSASHDGTLADIPVDGNGSTITVYVETGGVTRCYRILLEL